MVAAYFIACLPAHFDVPPADGALHGYFSTSTAMSKTNLYLKTGDNFNFIKGQFFILYKIVPIGNLYLKLKSSN